VRLLLTSDNLDGSYPIGFFRPSMKGDKILPSIINLKPSIERMSAARWFAKCGLSAVLLLIACGLATGWFGNRLQVPAITTCDGTLITLNRYAKEPIPDVVLVGSSLTFRLKEEYFWPGDPLSRGWRSWRTTSTFPNWF
jgi:hypothetical protein